MYMSPLAKERNYCSSQITNCLQTDIWIREVRTKGVAILLSSDGKTWKLLDEINDWSIRPFTKEPKKNHIQWRECNTESYQRSKSSSLSNKRQPLLWWTFESLTHSHLSSQELFYCIYQYTTTIKINVKRENR